MKTVCPFLITFLLSITFAGLALAGQSAGYPPWTVRAVADEELLRLERTNPDLDMNTCLEILSRLNSKESFYIRQDMREGRPLRVPIDFNSYRSWTPLPVRMPEVPSRPKFILVVKNIPFVGWYESGVLVGDSQACIGNSGQDTRPGLYRVLEKDEDHRSKSYLNDFGSPAWMPFSLRIYEAVWIHAGNVFGARCSHGCVILPVEKAESLFLWADEGTCVLVLESLDDLADGSF
ncbi:MAG TPA: L,D-transpeptidase [Syntrophobacteraceae bacterium]|nr:L,D-transpeptidase [Syntrophobacteraceae bacterium]